MEYILIEYEGIYGGGINFDDLDVRIVHLRKLSWSCSIGLNLDLTWLSGLTVNWCELMAANFGAILSKFFLYCGTELPSYN